MNLNSEQLETVTGGSDPRDEINTGKVICPACETENDIPVLTGRRITCKECGEIICLS